MKTKAAEKQKPEIWLQENEASGHFDNCACRLEAEYAEEGTNGSPAFFMCPMHQAAADLLKACKAAGKRWGRLHDMISDLVEDGKINAALFPDDYDAIVLTLTKCVEADAVVTKAVSKAEPKKPGEPNWFA